MLVSNVAALFGLLAAANLGAWAWALVVFDGQPMLLGTALLAWSLGLRHVVLPPAERGTIGSKAAAMASRRGDGDERPNRLAAFARAVAAPALDATIAAEGAIV